MKSTRISVTIASGLLIFLCNVTNAFAASTTIGLSPQTGSFGKPSTVSIVIDGHGDKFNAAQATITLSSNLKIKDLTLGDCNFSFLHTPSAQEPSFAGFIVSTYSTRCTVYTAILIPVAKGRGTITVTKAAAKRYGDAANILSATNNGAYNLTGTATADTDTESTSQPGLYTLNLKITKAAAIVPDATVVLNTVSSKNKQQAITDSAGAVHFSNLQAGVYDATVTQGPNKVGETIINVSGANHVLTLGIDLSVQKSNPLMKAGSLLASLASNPLLLIAAMIIGVIVGVGVALLIIKLLARKKK